MTSIGKVGRNKGSNRWMNGLVVLQGGGHLGYSNRRGLRFQTAWCCSVLNLQYGVCIFRYFHLNRTFSHFVSFCNFWICYSCRERDIRLRVIGEVIGVTGVETVPSQVKFVIAMKDSLATPLALNGTIGSKWRQGCWITSLASKCKHRLSNYNQWWTNCQVRKRHLHISILCTTFVAQSQKHLGACHASS